MKVIENRQKTGYEGTAVALGNFDGLHVAHIRVIRNAIDKAKEQGFKSGVLLFNENTKTVTGGKRIELITPKEAKLELLEREKPDFVYIEDFNDEFMHLMPEDFIKLLVQKLSPKIISVGYDYRFGYKAQGDVKLLEELGKKYGFGVVITERVVIDNETVSSTYIRELIKNGDMERCERFLGRRYCVEGIVKDGFKNGQKMGIPTANVNYDKDMLIPKEGVYAGITYFNKRRLKSVINVGKNLTFNASDITIESHILDFNEDIYGEYIRISFAKRLRDVIKFDTKDELINKIKEDILEVEKMVL